MSNKNKHMFHLVDESPWPLIGSLSAMLLTLGFLQFLYFKTPKLMLHSILLLLLVMYQWWKDVSSESVFQGLHSFSVMLGLRWGMVLFITSEICFFFSFFWCFFHCSLSPTTQIGSVWPPLNLLTLNAFQVPLLNTFILISSGVSVTWAHHAIIQGNHNQTLRGLNWTVMLGGYFTFLQALEYLETGFSLSDSSYGSTFFLATGFHGFHVIVGTVFLVVTLIRAYKNHLSVSHHFGFEAAAWYWHFVDVVWLFLFIAIYWWGGV